MELVIITIIAPSLQGSQCHSLGHRAPGPVQAHHHGGDMIRGATQRKQTGPGSSVIMHAMQRTDRSTDQASYNAPTS